MYQQNFLIISFYNFHNVRLEDKDQTECKMVKLN